MAGKPLQMKFTALDTQLIAQLKERGAQRILDVGCGSGRFAARAASAGLEVTGIDPFVIPSEKRDFQFVKTRLQDFSPDGRFDAAVLSFTLHSISASERVELGRDLLMRHIKPDGLLMVVDYRRPELSLLNSLLWVLVYADEFLTIFVDGNTNHWRHFQDYISLPFVPRMLGVKCSDANPVGVSLLHMTYPSFNSPVEISVESALV